MISINNKPVGIVASNSDFTVDHYRSLLKVAKKNYTFTDYTKISQEGKFILWRHDCDFSLNRSLAIANIEAEEGVQSTFFLNIHSEFYNILEKSQQNLCLKIISLGHSIGLHFDGSYFESNSEDLIDKQVRLEADLIEQALGIRLTAFSFHNPSAFHLTCEKEQYGGLVNCYSKRFKTKVPYCSDSNGYWRFRRLYDVLEQATDPCLQVLTHPGWWQEIPMSPRQRIFRSAFGRANAAMKLNDQMLQTYGRENLAGAAQAIWFLQINNQRLFELCDYLWNTGQFSTLFIELWCLHERQINRLCKAMLRKQWYVSVREVNAFFDCDGMSVDGWRLFYGLFGDSWQVASGQYEGIYFKWVNVRNQLIHGLSFLEPAQLEEGCVYLCGVIQAMANWGKGQEIAYDGLEHLDSIGLPTYRTSDGSLGERLEEVKDEISMFQHKMWESFKYKITRTAPPQSAEDNYK